MNRRKAITQPRYLYSGKKRNCSKVYWAKVR